ncbi:MAG TPA: hypothetical protein VMU29_07690 [Smithella sp.]|nr:hypothetical protein [Smithella sp.]
MILKTKLFLGLVYLFTFIFTLAGFCYHYMRKLRLESGNVLTDNYNSMVYAKNMLSGLDDMKNSIISKMFNTNHQERISVDDMELFESGKDLFENNMIAVSNNITDTHEQEYVDKLRKECAIYLKFCRQINYGSDREPAFNDFMKSYEKLRQTVNSIYEINNQAVAHRLNKS